MNLKERKQQVIEKAHRLFIDKGYQATSIQDILDASAISKGTFYNYFPSKSELFKAVFTSIRNKHEEGRNELLIGEDLANIEIFIKQIDLVMESNKRNQLFTLIEEAFASNDPDLKKFVKRAQILLIQWINQRFIDLFGEDKRPYLLDCAILFLGMLQQTTNFHYTAKGPNTHQLEIIRYCVERLKVIVNDVSKTGIQLLPPELLKSWLPETTDSDTSFVNDLLHKSSDFKKMIVQTLKKEPERMKYLQTLDFIQEELLNNKTPRTFLIESSLLSLKMCPELQGTEELREFQMLVTSHLQRIAKPV
nr:TetR/AcrR family transcriptional regulator [Mesobacillus harenae]